MSEAQESELLALLNAAPLAMWRDGPSSPWAVDVFTVGGWRVAVFFDGVDFDGWDYIEHVIAPDGVRYDSWPQSGENALPMSITHWQPAEMGPIEHVVRAMTRIAESFRAMASARRNQ